uniref:Uncharacterized protein n=1 Tax=Leersia perrieri TaxID=77586 RepID=A0A0D9XYT5_9ORYZ
MGDGSDAGVALPFPCWRQRRPLLAASDLFDLCPLPATGDGAMPPPCRGLRRWRRTAVSPRAPPPPPEIELMAWPHVEEASAGKMEADAEEDQQMSQASLGKVRRRLGGRRRREVATAAGTEGGCLLLIPSRHAYSPRGHADVAYSPIAADVEGGERWGIAAETDEGCLLLAARPHRVRVAVVT